tara:strand:- start:15 stop:203 length:189 start_codon:yes stop_codon:yes gene_type:complete
MDNYKITTYTRKNGLTIYTLEKNDIPVKESTNILLIQTALINLEKFEQYHASLLKLNNQPKI